MGVGHGVVGRWLGVLRGWLVFGKVGHIKGKTGFVGLYVIGVVK